MRTHRLPLNACRLRPLATCLALMFSTELMAATTPLSPRVPVDVVLPPASPESHAAAPPRARQDLQSSDPSHPHATTLLVTSCTDNVSGSLRDAVQTASGLSGDVTIEFDLDQMQCSRITLLYGEIAITNQNLTIQGPGADKLAIDGDYDLGRLNRVFNHTGLGTLTISGLSIEDAMYLGTGNQVAYGGCILSNGTVGLSDSILNGCNAVADAKSGGGGVSAQKVSMVRSKISYCRAHSYGDFAEGGGVRTGVSGFYAVDSTIDHNIAHSDSPSAFGEGGGLSTGPAYLLRSTLFRNQSEQGGGLSTVEPFTMNSSTVSGNAAYIYGGLHVRAAATFYNSTIAFNRAGNGGYGGVSADSVNAKSSIFAYNVSVSAAGQEETDVRSHNGIITGKYNIILATAGGTMAPAGTSTACPRLGSLHDNGGPTLTHELLPGSPAIDNGHIEMLDTDQRGMGFARVVGPSADIGAFEWSPGTSDVINTMGFDCQNPAPPP